MFFYGITFGVTPYRKGNKFVKIPVALFDGPEILKITRCLDISRQEAMGYLVQYLSLQYRNKQRPFRTWWVDRNIVDGWSEALTLVGWGEIKDKKFCFKPPDYLINRPNRAIGGVTRQKLASRNAGGEFVYLNGVGRKPTVWRSDAEGNLIEKKPGEVMPRINIEDSLFKDNRFYELIGLLGDKKRAIGALVEAWVLAQAYVDEDNPGGVIPEDHWNQQKISNEIITVGLARKIPNGIEVCGGRVQFAWLRQRQDAAKRGGQAKSRKNKSKVGRVSEPGRQPEVAGPCPPTLTHTHTLTQSLTNTHTNNSTNYIDRVNTKIHIPKTEIKRPDASIELNRKIWSAYETNYKNRYGVDPTRNAKVNAQISQLAKRLGTEAVEIISFYLKHNDGFYISKCHPIDFCLRDAESLRTQWLRGKAITRSDVKRFEQTQERFNLRQAIERGEI